MCFNPFFLSFLFFFFFSPSGAEDGAWLKTLFGENYLSCLFGHFEFFFFVFEVFGSHYMLSRNC